MKKLRKKLGVSMITKSKTTQVARDPAAPGSQRHAYFEYLVSGMRKFGPQTPDHMNTPLAA